MLLVAPKWHECAEGFRLRITINVDGGRNSTLSLAFGNCHRGGGEPLCQYRHLIAAQSPHSFGTILPFSVCPIGAGCANDTQLNTLHAIRYLIGRMPLVNWTENVKKTSNTHVYDTPTVVIIIITGVVDSNPSCNLIRLNKLQIDECLFDECQCFGFQYRTQCRQRSANSAHTLQCFAFDDNHFPIVQLLSLLGEWHAYLVFWLI